MKKFRFVIVGSGNIAKTYVAAVKKLDDVEVVGAVSRSGRKPEGIPEDREFEIAPSLKEIKTDFDGVILATPNGMHHTGAIEAANLGKHVITEKPLDITVHAMDCMISACRKQNVKLGVAYQRRLRPDNIAVKKLLDEGAFGKLVAAELSALFYRDQAYYDSAPYRGNKEIDGGGPFIQQASHNIDIYTWFFGLPVDVVSMCGTFLHKMEGEDHGVAVMKHADGMIGAITASTSTYPGLPSTLKIISEKGTVIMENDCITMWEVKGIDNPAAVKPGEMHDASSSAAVSDSSGHESVVRDFVDAVREDRDPAVPGESARLATDLILRIYHSNKY